MRCDQAHISAPHRCASYRWACLPASQPAYQFAFYPVLPVPVPSFCSSPSKTRNLQANWRRPFWPSAPPSELNYLATCIRTHSRHQQPQQPPPPCNRLLQTKPSSHTHQPRARRDRPGCHSRSRCITNSIHGCDVCWVSARIISQSHILENRSSSLISLRCSFLQESIR